MPEEYTYSDYSFKYNKAAKERRGQLSSELRSILDEIEDNLTRDPDYYKQFRKVVENETYVYEHPPTQLLVMYKLHRESKIVEFKHLFAPKLFLPKQLFISYSHQDSVWLEELKKFLQDLESLDGISLWDDTMIKASEEWKAKIEDALKSARAAILLISQDFLRSDFINDVELPRLLEAAHENGVQIFWIVVRPSNIEEKAGIIKYQAAHKEPPLSVLELPQREIKYKEIYQKIKEAITDN